MPHPSTATPPPDRRPGEPDPLGESGRFGAHDADGAQGVFGADGADGADGASASDVSPASPHPVTPARSGPDHVWSPRLVRLGVPRPGPAARRAHRFGVPLVPLLVAALVATAFLAARGGTEQSLSTGGRPGGDPVGVPSPVATGDGRAKAAPRVAGAPDDTRTAETGAVGTRTDDTPTADATTDGSPTRTAPPQRSALPERSNSPTPSRGGSTGSTARPTPTRSATSGGGSARPVSFEALRVGDCFDIDRDAPGTALRRSCDTPHNAELVARLRLTGLHATDRAIREAATLLCRAPLRGKAAQQPLGTRWTTFVQYPYRTSYLLGSDTVACSLAAPSATGGKLSHRLR